MINGSIDALKGFFKLLGEDNKIHLYLKMAFDIHTN